MQVVELLWIAIIGGGLAWLMLTTSQEPERRPEPKPPSTPLHAERPQRPRRFARRSPLSKHEEESRWREIIKHFEP